MSLNIYCPHCTRLVDVPDDYVGAGVRCPQCDVVFEVRQTGFTAEVPINDGRLPYEVVSSVKAIDFRLPRSARYRPSRGGLLLTLGGASIGLSVAGLSASVITLVAPVLFGSIAFALGLAAWIMGQHDMEKIRLAVIDPYADKQTRLGWVSGIIGTFLSVAVMLCALCGGYLMLASLVANANS